jgi:hypothetical protein
MKNTSVPAALVLGISLALGIVTAGYFVADAVFRIRAAERYVTVKGLDEREVQADLAIWPLMFTETANDLTDLQSRLDFDRQAIRKFLRSLGFDDGAVSEAPPLITDYHAQGYTGQNMPPNRYRAEAVVTLRTADVALAKAAMEKSGELVKQGIVLASNYGRGTEFLFNGLNRIKPEMIAAATENARQAAEQFARDSGSRVGAIRSASQGLFTIRNRDVNTPEIKIVRVVTTVNYFLVDN